MNSAAQGTEVVEYDEPETSITALLTSSIPLLRMEGAVLLGLGLLVYWKIGGTWPALLVFLLVPDLSMLGYLGSPRIGAVSYNLVHVYLGPSLLAAVAIVMGSEVLLSLALIWFSHINLDRMLGYGLKRDTVMQDTHLSLSK